VKNYCLLLNADFSPMSHISVQHAFKMLNRGVAVVEEEHPTDLINGFWPRPTKLRLVRYVNMAWYYAKPVLWSKHGIMLRDRGKCAYCGGNAQTIDHVFPASRGGKSTWQNTVAACLKCNQKKNDHTLEELGWHLKFVPRVPLRSELAAAKIEMTKLN
jgi:5-methylcytosine-specific restriction endonuclease McrA